MPDDHSNATISAPTPPAADERTAKERLTAVTDAILQSCDAVGGVNCPHGVNLPSRTAVVDILQRAESLCFPGFHVDENLTTDKLAYVTGHKVADLARALVDQVQKDLHATDLQSRKQSAPACDDTAEVAPDLAQRAHDVVWAFLEAIPKIRAALSLDIEALLEGDPAAQSQDEVILSYPGLRAILVHRIAHHFWTVGCRLVARMMHEHVHSQTGIDIHPGAQIGNHFCIDHGTGVVVGETCIIGDHVKLYQGVTLGALSVRRALAGQKRHPTLEDHVTIYAGSTILGGETVVGAHSVVGGNTWLVKSVAPFSVVESDPIVRVRSKGASAKDPWHWEI